MKLTDLAQELSSCTYPGRGIILGRSEDNGSAVIAYFIMGRSENSRNRIFVPTADGIQTKAFDEGKMTDPSLIIYAPVRQYQDKTIVTNGDQTDTIYDVMQAGRCYRHALLQRTFEPDSPNFTPRISGVVKPNGGFNLSILKSDNGDKDNTLRYFYEYESCRAGQGRYIHTYLGDGSPLPSFDGEPTLVTIPGNLETFTRTVWDNLNSDNKVSLYTCFIDLQTGKHTSKIVNRNV
ncbi:MULTISPECIES: IMP cyclohydrolase [Caproicibacterium]|jgi:IMP cyclohydrolase|uniref:Inosine monophosphate cyclohydrolase n=1 Tax=Caproicibacterium lactatifermentans TaxID=2666138 RepID=A0A859DT97_9FIRM|nr:IMP cyclohydrolase [Caproicibacterium lactatifermentans]ARP50869.1 inosine monophosphate cyclohydrolase [Ruminococcaceae bacterium CPB6]QKN23403.1 inosine monophosphate cyclohydrolase [Caproicibacterium lactatifermentans]QKO29919.1 inosine monophosphate cyclohydrolase [Caproicibacterium lactatifermentans]